MRKMAEVIHIESVVRHPNADTLSIVQVGGWSVVIRTGDFEIGDTAVFCQQDAWVPYELAPFLEKDKPREYLGVRGNLVRAIKLRGVVSNGLLLKADPSFEVGSDVSEALGIQKWEPPIPASLAGLSSGSFPSFIRKTDQTRIESCLKDFMKSIQGSNPEKFVIEHKMDGGSMTIFKFGDDAGVCSRNINLKLDQVGNSFVDIALKYDIIGALQKYGRNLAIQGELCGPGIQRNIHNLAEKDLFVFDIWDIDSQKYLSPSERNTVLKDLDALGCSLKPVHTFGYGVDLQELGLSTVPELKKFVDRGFENTKVIEGMVFKSLDSDFTFKVINDTYLLKQD